MKEEEDSLRRNFLKKHGRVLSENFLDLMPYLKENCKVDLDIDY